jgi:hypothetical protein
MPLSHTLGAKSDGMELAGVRHKASIYNTSAHLRDLQMEANRE